MIKENIDLEEMAKNHPNYFRIKEEQVIKTQQGPQSIYSFELCEKKVAADTLPTLFLTAGVHGIEAIGVKILMNFLHHLVSQSEWNPTTRTLLSQMRIVGIPILNPAGYVAGTRSNGRNVDLMRNSPVQSDESWPIVGGQRFSRSLPFYRGVGVLEIENKILTRLMKETTSKSSFVISLDLHSGFGMNDSVWTPYASKKGLPPTWEHYSVLKELLDKTLEQHVYTFEPQSKNYCTHGDMWDYLYDLSLKESNCMYLPLTLEIGSWAWIKKSPISASTLKGFFNPMHAHREKRVLRRHLPFLNFLTQVVAGYQSVYPHLSTKKRESKKLSSAS